MNAVESRSDAYITNFEHYFTLFFIVSIVKFE